MAPATLKSNTSKHKTSGKRRRRLTPEAVMLIRQIVLGVFLLLVLSAVISGIWYGTRVDALTIDEVSVTGGETVSHSAVEASVTDLLQGTYFKLVPRQFAWLYPEQEIINRLYELERVQAVKLERIGGTQLHIEITEYLPTALWCADAASDQCLFVDEVGYAFTAAPNLSGGALVRYSTLGREPVRGEQLLPLSDLAAVSWFAEAVRSEFGWTVTHIELDSAGDVFYILPDRSELKVTLATDPSEVLANLTTILESDSFIGLEPGEFQYIDLRFGNKVFVNREPWDDAQVVAATSSLVWDELTAATASVIASEPETAAADNEILAVPIIEEADEVVVIEPTPEASAPPVEEASEVLESEGATTTATTTESD